MSFLADPGVIGILTPKVDVDARIGVLAAGATITDAFATLTDAPSGGTIVVDYRNAAAGGGDGITVTIPDGDTSAAGTGSMVIAAGGSVYRRITDENGTAGAALNLGGYVEVPDVGGGGGPPVGSDVMLATLSDVKDHLKITGTDKDTILNRLIGAASVELEDECDRHFLRVPYGPEVYRVSPQMDSILPRQYPVDTAYGSEVVVEGSTTLTSSDYRWEGGSDVVPDRLVRLSGGVRRKWSGSDVTLTYQGGYSNSPGAIREAVIQKAAHLYNQTRKSGRAQLGLSSKSPAESALESYVADLSYWDRAIKRYRRRF